MSKTDFYLYLPISFSAVNLSIFIPWNVVRKMALVKQNVEVPRPKFYKRSSQSGKNWCFFSSKSEQAEIFYQLPKSQKKGNY